MKGMTKFYLILMVKVFIQQCNSYARIDLCNGAQKSQYPWYPLTENNKCFQLVCNETIWSNTIIYAVYIFNTYIIKVEDRSNGTFERPKIIYHELSLDCLFCVKYFQADKIFSGIDLYRKNPEYFNKNCSHFEEICKKEYNEIEKQKNQLNILINDNLSKQEYYDSLENKIKELEFQKQQLEEKLEKIEEELEKIKDGEKKVELDKQKIE